MDSGKFVEMQVNDHPFFQVQLMERRRRLMQSQLHIEGAKVFMKINYEIEFLSFKKRDKLLKVFLIEPYLFQVRIFAEKRMILFFCEIMDPDIRKLVFQAADHRGGKNDVPD